MQEINSIANISELGRAQVFAICINHFKLYILVELLSNIRGELVCTVSE